VSTTLLIQDGDWVINPANGRPITISDRDKLRQDLREGLSIAIQPNGFGAGLDDLMGRPTGVFQFRIEVQRRIRGFVLALQRIQDQFLPAQRPNTERIQAISSLLVQNVDLGAGAPAKTGYMFQLKVRPVQGTNVSIGATLAP
jgi:hypothetical protein